MKKSSSRKSHSSTKNHTSVQKSTTLKRRYVSRPKITIHTPESDTSKDTEIIVRNLKSSSSSSTPLDSSEPKSSDIPDLAESLSVSKSSDSDIDADLDTETNVESIHDTETTPESNPIDEPNQSSSPEDFTPEHSEDPAETPDTNDSISTAFAQPVPDFPPPERPSEKFEDDGETIPPPTPRELKNEATQKALDVFMEQQEDTAFEEVVAEDSAPDYSSSAYEPSEEYTQTAEPTASPTKTLLSQSFSRERRRSSLGKFIMAFATSAVCIGILGYFVSINLPSISVHVAAMQTGIEAAYPSYVPREYQLAGVSTQNDHIIINFAGDNGKKFNITEEKTSWDSTALLNNYVKLNWDDYDTIREQGLTIYTYNSNATWVNGNTLYHIVNLNGILTKKQIKNIATSLR